MKRILVLAVALLVCGAAMAQTRNDNSRLPGGWVREKGEVVEIGALEGESRCLTYEEIQAGLPAEEFIAIKRAFRNHDLGLQLIGDGIGYAAGYGLVELLYCTLGGYEFNRANYIILGIGAATALTGAIILPVANKKIDRILEVHNSSVGLGPDTGGKTTITILPTVVTFNGPGSPAAGRASAGGLNLAPGVGMSVRF